eukprot:6204629-Pleurochrysis_carterae.AAC.2
MVAFRCSKNSFGKTNAQRMKVNAGQAPKRAQRAEQAHPARRAQHSRCMMHHAQYPIKHVRKHDK